jgi:[histone H3]-dimethyl-L-lysine9 demethylase
VEREVGAVVHSAGQGERIPVIGILLALTGRTANGRASTAACAQEGGRAHPALGSRPPEPGERSACHLWLVPFHPSPRAVSLSTVTDTCMTSIFSTSWMCRLCGREACAECYTQVEELTAERKDATESELAALQAKREKHAHINPFFLSCTRRNEHSAKDFSPMSRFSKDELLESIAEMEVLLSGDKTPDSSEAAASVSLTNGNDDPPVASGSGNGAEPSSDVLSLNHDANTDSKPPAAASNGSANVPEPSSFASAPSASASEDAVALASISSHTPRVFADVELTDDVFADAWAKGEPLVVTGLLEKFRLQWTPEYFAQKYGTQTCLILECQTDQNKRVSVGEFFSWFGKYEGRRECWKLKVCSSL